MNYNIETKSVGFYMNDNKETKSLTFWTPSPKSAFFRAATCPVREAAPQRGHGSRSRQRRHQHERLLCVRYCGFQGVEEVGALNVRIFGFMVEATVFERAWSLAAQTLQGIFSIGHLSLTCLAQLCRPLPSCPNFSE